MENTYKNLVLGTLFKSGKETKKKNEALLKEKVLEASLC